MTDPLPLAFTHTQVAMLTALAQLPTHWHFVTAPDDVKACDDLVTLRCARRHGKGYIITVYGLAELAALGE